MRFHKASEPGSSDLQRLQQTLRRRVPRLFQRRDLLDEPTVANMLAWQAAGGFSVDASVRIAGRDRAGRERLPRYCARPLFALERLRIDRLPPPRAHAHSTESTGIRHVLYSPARPTPDDRSLLVLSPLELLAALSRLIPPPRLHRHRYHGVLAPYTALRQRLTALAPAAQYDPPPPPAPAAEPESASAAPSRWARLLARIHEVFPLLCPECGAQMRILALLTDPLHHDRHPPPSPPASHPAFPDPRALHLPPTRLPTPIPSWIDQTPAFDPFEPDPIPDFNFDPDHGV